MFRLFQKLFLCTMLIALPIASESPPEGREFVPVLLLENDYVRVWKVTILPHTRLKMRHYDNPRVLLPTKGGALKRIETSGRTTPLDFEAGKAFWQAPNPPGMEHGHVNESDAPIELISVELKLKEAALQN